MTLAQGLEQRWNLVPDTLAQALAGVEDMTFNDLRGAAVTRLAPAGCTEVEVATITAHTLNQANSNLDRRHLTRDPALAEKAIRKLERRTKALDHFETR